MFVLGKRRQLPPGKSPTLLMLIYCRMLADSLLESFCSVNGRKYSTGPCCSFEVLKVDFCGMDRVIEDSSSI